MTNPVDKLYNKLIQDTDIKDMLINQSKEKYQKHHEYYIKAKDRVSAYYQKNKARIRSYAKTYAEAHREELNAKARLRYRQRKELNLRQANNKYYSELKTLY